jgi:hypothetical protein
VGFAERVSRLPRLGLGVSTEYGAGDVAGSLDVLALRAEHPAWAGFLEVGVETAKGLDRHARAWAERGLPTTYHYLDVNLDEPEDSGCAATPGSGTSGAASAATCCCCRRC